MRSSSGLREGRVRDARTGEPIGEAYVIARWMGTLSATGQTACVHAESGVSDDEGRYRIVDWTGEAPTDVLKELDPGRPGATAR